MHLATYYTMKIFLLAIATDGYTACEKGQMKHEGEDYGESYEKKINISLNQFPGLTFLIFNRCICYTPE